MADVMFLSAEPASGGNRVNFDMGGVVIAGGVDGGGGGGGGYLQQAAEAAQKKTWETDAFEADLCESLLPASPLPGVYCQTIKSLLDEVLNMDLTEAQRTGVIQCIRGFETSLSIFRRLEMFMSWYLPFHLSRIVDEVSKQLQGSTVGQVHILPFVYNSLTVCVVTQERAGSFTVAVINTDPECSPYIPCTVDETGKMRVQSVIELRNVAKQKICSEAFWSCIVKSMTTPADLISMHFLPWLVPGKTFDRIIDESPKATVSGSKNPLGNLWKSMIHAVKYVLKRANAQKSEGKAVRAMIKYCFLKRALSDLDGVEAIGTSTRLVFRAALSNSSLCLARNQAHVTEEFFNQMRELIDKLNDSVQKKKHEGESGTVPPPELILDKGWEKTQRPDLFPLCETLRRVENVDAFAGTAVEQPRYIPVNFLKIVDRVSTFDEALNLLEDALGVVNRVINQNSVIKNAPHHIVAIITKLFLEVLPAPYGPKTAQRDDMKATPCIWTTAKVRYGQQMHAIYRVWNLCELYMWCSTSFPLTRDFESSRIAVVISMAAIVDACVRLVAIDHPSIVAKHLRGYRKKPGFAVDVSAVAGNTENMLSSNPAVAIARAAALDYFNEVMEPIPTPNIMLMGWEERQNMCKATLAFLRQTCIIEGFPVKYAPQMWADQDDQPNSILQRYYTEVTPWRDVFIVLKALFLDKKSIPSCESCINCCVATPTVEVNHRSGNYLLEVNWMHKDLATRKLVPPRPPSYAMATKFTSPFDATTEDDILHIKNLPSFDDSLGQRDSELLLSYLTAPYVRIPLVLNFFATEDRISCMSNSTMQQLLEAVLFEPGRFLNHLLEGKCPEHVPSEDDKLVSCAPGLLMNEIMFSPAEVVQPILKLVELAREMDAGTVQNGQVVDLILYLVRVAARVDSYFSYFVRLSEATGKIGSRSTRGLDFDTDVKAAARKASTELRNLTVGVFVPMIEAWMVELATLTEKSIDEITSQQARLAAHLIIVLRNLEFGEYNKQHCSMLIASSTFLTSRHTFERDEKALDIPPFEIFAAIAQQRRNIAQFLHSSRPVDLSYVMDSAVRVTTSTGNRAEGHAYEWGFIAGASNCGRFTRVDNDAKNQPGSDSRKPELIADLVEAFGEGKLGSTIPDGIICLNEGLHDVEINVQTCSLTFKAAHLISIPGPIASNNDVYEIFYDPKQPAKLNSMQCAIVQDAEHRQWVRLVGQEHDIQYWNGPDPRMPLPGTNMRFFPDDLSPIEEWIFNIVEPVRRKFFMRSFFQPPIFLLLPEKRLTEHQSSVVIDAVCSKTGRKLKEIVAFRDHQTAHVYDLISIGRRWYRSQVYSSNAYFSYRELHPVVADKFALWPAWERHAAGDFTADECFEPSQSAVILRHPTHPENVSKALETYLPSRLLWGLIPDCILQTHRFWQDPDDNIRGYPKDKDATHILWGHWRDVTDFDATVHPAADGSAKQTTIRLIRFARKREAPRASERAVLVSQKLQEVDEVDEELERMRTRSMETEDSTDDSMADIGEGMFRQSSVVVPERKEVATIEDRHLLLVNLMYARKDTPLHSLATLLSRLEPLSYVLAWSLQIDLDSSTAGAVSLDLVQLPRLKLSFAAKADVDGSIRLFSLDHAHLHVTNVRPKLVTELLQGMPHSVLLGDSNDNISVIVPAFHVVRPKIQTSPFSTELVVDRGMKAWYQHLDTRYYLYPVHVSLSFLFTPTLASALYLISLRFLHCEYEDVFRLAGSIGTDMALTKEEKQNFQLLETEDRRHEALACRGKIGLLVADSPVDVGWYLPIEVSNMIRSYSSIPMSCRLNPIDELRLLRICVATVQKMEILVEVQNKTKFAFLENIASNLNENRPIYYDLSPAQTRQTKDFMNQVTTTIEERLDVRVSREDIARLIVKHQGRASTQITEFQRCVLHNRLAFLDAEQRAIEAGVDKIPAEFKIVKRKPDPLWQFYRDYDPASAKLPDQQPEYKNDLGREVHLSDNLDYFYCGMECRKPGQCRCKDCDGECGPNSGCPCPSCERWNKKNLPKARFLPETITYSSQRILSFYDLNQWIETIFDRFPNDWSIKEAESAHETVRQTSFRFNQGVSMRSSENSFIRYYEMMTGTTKCRMGRMDSAKDFVTLLFPLCYEARKPQCALGHLMHYLVNNPQVWSRLPKFSARSNQDDRTKIKTVYQAIVNQSMIGAKYPDDAPPEPVYSTSVTLDVTPRPSERPDTTLPILKTRVLPVLEDCEMHRRTWDKTDLTQLEIADKEDVAVSDELRKQLRDQPLVGCIPENFLVFASRTELGEGSIDKALPFNLKAHPAAKTSVAQSMIDRLAKDMEDFASQENGARAPHIVGLCPIAKTTELLMGGAKAIAPLKAKLLKLLDDLVKLRQDDIAYVNVAFEVIRRTANAMPTSRGSKRAEALMALRRLADQETKMDLTYVLASLTSIKAAKTWMQLNPFLTPATCEAIFSLTTTTLLRANRVGHANRAAEAVRELLALLKKAEHPPASIGGVAENAHATSGGGAAASFHHYIEAVVASTQQKADSLAGLLACKRVYFDQKFSYDPRFLVFEYTWNIVLRSRQKCLIDEIYTTVTTGTGKSAEEKQQMMGQSIVKQMIMGQGKSTVVAPLLSMMLADGRNQVMLVVPPALLDFTRSILRSTFSCVVQKQVFCFIVDRGTEIDSEVYSKFMHARNCRGIVVTTPSTLKSVFLKYMECMDRLEDQSRRSIPKQDKEMVDIGRILKLWRKDAILVMDEVDMLLHPLRSELNFPIGAKHEIDFAPMRWKIPIHMIDALFFASTGHISVGLKETPETLRILGNLSSSIQRGLAANAMQSTPHTTLLNLEYYEKEIRRPVAEWMLLFVKSHFPTTVISDEESIRYMMLRPSAERDPELNKKVNSLEPDHVKTLNLCFDWVNAFLPHVMQKIDRVSFGIMTADDMKRAREEHPNMPRSRFVTAIPFIGKDLPSSSSEFAHPDVVIGLTILAYRYEGLRMTDYSDILHQLFSAVEKEVGRFSQRRTTVMYNKWVGAAGARIIQSFSYTDAEKQREDQKAKKKAKEADAMFHRASKIEGGDLDDEDGNGMGGMVPSQSMTYSGSMVYGAEGGVTVDVLPLKLLKQANNEETQKLFKVFKRCPEVIHWYLCNTVFPNFMRHQLSKLSASGQELGGNILFPRRIGFSGTPSDLLPVELGSCEYEAGTDGKLVDTLTSPKYMSVKVMEPGWTVKSLLDHIANANPPYHALIDTGALITGLSNLQVAQYLLKHGLPSMEGVVFLDEFDRKMILVRATGRVLKLAECGIPKVKRFAVYDQVHTTGMDIEHTPNAVAIQTLGKDMVFRDFSQGAYRMRGITQGQTVCILVIPEVHDLINRTLEPMRKPGEIKFNLLTDVTAWLLVNSIRSEHVQANQLALQTISNVWRKEAFRQLASAADDGEFNANKDGYATNVKPGTLKALTVYREPVDYRIATYVPQPKMFSETVGTMISTNESFIVGEDAKKVTGGILGRCKREDEIDNPVIDVQMVQEQEEEREQEEEKQKEHEIEMEKFVDLAYSRDDEVASGWAVASLKDFTRATQFYKLADFHLHKRRPINFPDSVMLSRNYFNPKWSGHRRLKNSIITMEWIPDTAALKVRARPDLDFGAIEKERAVPAMGSALTLLGNKGQWSPQLAKNFCQMALGLSSSVETAPESALVAAAAAFDKGAESAVDYLSSNEMRLEEDGRYVVALTLAEAETMRRVLHIKRQKRQALVEGARTEVCLRIVPSFNVTLEKTAGFKDAATAYQRDRCYHAIRFFDGDLQYVDNELNLLLRALHTQTEKARQAFFLQTLACRRRAAQRWEKTPVALLFSLQDGFTFLKQKALALAFRQGLEAKDLPLSDAFIAINASQSGQLTPDEIWGALRYCGLTSVTAVDVLDFLQIADTHHEGTLQYSDFLSLLTGKSDPDDEDEKGGGAGGAGGANRARLPNIEPFGTEEVRKVRASREEQRRKEEADTNQQLELEDRKIREEIERETAKEELALIQTALNPQLDDHSLSYSLRKDALPKLTSWFGPINTQVIDDIDKGSDLKQNLQFYSLTNNSAMRLVTRSVRVIKTDPLLTNYWVNVEFRYPFSSRMKRNGKLRTKPICQTVEQLPLLAMITNYYQLSMGKRQSGKEDNSDDDGTDTDGNTDEDDEDDESVNSMLAEHGKLAKYMFLFKEPSTDKDKRVKMLSQGQVVNLIPDESTSKAVGTDTVVWMKVKQPVEGWIAHSVNGHVLWAQQTVLFKMQDSGRVDVSTVWDWSAIFEDEVAPTKFSKQGDISKLDASSDDDEGDFGWFTNFNMMDFGGGFGGGGGGRRRGGYGYGDDEDEYGDEDGEDESDDTGSDGDRGGNKNETDLEELMAELRKKKELRPGDLVTRNPNEWTHGDIDGGQGSVGKVIQSTGDGNVQVQWPSGKKETHAWGSAGKFELIKVGTAPEDDFGGKSIVTVDRFMPLLYEGGFRRCNNCSTQCNERDAGWFRCNACRDVNVCSNCLRSWEHEEHDFSDMKALADKYKLTHFVRGASMRVKPEVREPILGWADPDVPIEGSIGVIQYFDEEENCLVVKFDVDGREFRIHGNDAELIDSRINELTSPLAQLLLMVPANARGAGHVKALDFVVDQSLHPEIVGGKFKVGDRVKAKYKKGSTWYAGIIRAVLPNSLYTVLCDDGDVDPKCPEADILPCPFKVGMQVRVISLDNITHYGSKAKIPAWLRKGMIGVVQEITEGYSRDPQDEERYIMDVRVRFKRVNKVFSLTEFNLQEVDEAKWFLRLGVNSNGNSNGNDDAAAVPFAPASSGVSVSLERTYERGQLFGEFFFKGQPMCAKMDDMTIVDQKTRSEVIGYIKRTPEDPWEAARQMPDPYDGKWHNFALCVTPAGVTGILDGEETEFDWPHELAKDPEEESDNADDEDEEEDDEDEEHQDDDDEDSKSSSGADIKEEGENSSVDDDDEEKEEGMSRKQTTAESAVSSSSKKKSKKIEQQEEGEEEDEENDEENQNDDDDDDEDEEAEEAVAKLAKISSSSKKPKKSSAPKKMERFGSDDEEADEDNDDDDDETGDDDDDEDEGNDIEDDQADDPEEELSIADGDEKVVPKKREAPAKKRGAGGPRKKKIINKKDLKRQKYSDDDSDNNASGSDDDDDDGSSSSSSGGSDISRLSDLDQMCAHEALALNVRNPIYVMPVNQDFGAERAKYGQTLPVRHVGSVTLNWGDAATHQAAIAKATAAAEIKRAEDMKKAAEDEEKKKAERAILAAEKKAKKEEEKKKKEEEKEKKQAEKKKKINADEEGNDDQVAEDDDEESSSSSSSSDDDDDHKNDDKKKFEDTEPAYVIAETLKQAVLEEVSACQKANDDLGRWTCVHCTELNNRRHEKCWKCEEPRIAPEQQKDGIPPKVLAVTHRSREAIELRKKFEARRRHQYQKMLEELDMGPSSLI